VADEASDALKYAYFSHSQSPLVFKDDYTAFIVLLDPAKHRLLSNEPIDSIHIHHSKNTANIQLISDSGITITSSNIDGCGILEYLASTEYYTVNETCKEVINADNISKISTGIYVNNFQQLEYLYQIESNLAATNSPKLIFNAEYVLNVSNYQAMAAYADEIFEISIREPSFYEYNQQARFKSVKKLDIFRRFGDTRNLENISFGEIGSVYVYGNSGYETFKSIRNLPIIPEGKLNSITTLISSLPGSTFKALELLITIKSSTVEDLNKFIVKHSITLEFVASDERNKVVLDGKSIKIFHFSFYGYAILSYRFDEFTKSYGIY
jgi:hypothetical protein